MNCPRCGSNDLYVHDQTMYCCRLCGKTFQKREGSMKVLWFVLIVWFVAITQAFGFYPKVGEEPKLPVKKDTVQRGILLYREVYDYDGKRIAIEESSDAPARTAPTQEKASTPKARQETSQYTWINGHWYKGEGDWWVYCKACEGLPGPNGEPAKAARSVPLQTFRNTAGNYNPDHICNRCGTSQYVISGFNADGTHNHQCPKCGNVWRH